MPQRPTTHKDLHKAAIGWVFALVFLAGMQAAVAETPVRAASASIPVKSDSTKLVKKGSSKGPDPSAAVPAVKPAAGKLREIPLSTLNGENTDAKSAQKPETKETKKVESKEAKKTDENVSGKKAVSPVKTKRATAITPRLNNGLVPPPPPVVPLGMDALGMYAQPVDFLSLKELEGRKKELTARFNELDSIVGDGTRQIRERKERAELFESLYQEGVVSRKELETARREAGEIDRDLKFKQDELESVKISMKAVNNRLAVLKKAQEKLNAGKKGSGSSKAKTTGKTK